jgi:hypothetical protein
MFFMIKNHQVEFVNVAQKRMQSIVINPNARINPRIFHPYITRLNRVRQGA